MTPYEFSSFSSLYTSSGYSTSDANYGLVDSSYKANCIHSLFTSLCATERSILSSATNIAEIGCGPGHLIAKLRDVGIFNPDSVFHGWDINPSAISLARDNYANITFFCQDLLESPSTYDLVICADVFEHVTDPYFFLTQLYKKAASFLFYCPLETSLMSLLSNGKIVDASFRNVGHLHFYFKASLDLLLLRCGFDIKSYQYASDWRWSSHRSKSLLRKSRLFFFVMLERFFPSFSSALIGNHIVLYATRSKD